MLFSLPLGPARLERPESVFRYTFEHFVHGHRRQEDGLPGSNQLAVVQIEAVADGDVQVLAASEQGQAGTLVVDLGVLADYPGVESVLASTRVHAGRPLPNIRELLFYPGTSFPEAAT